MPGQAPSSRCLVRHPRLASHVCLDVCRTGGGGEQEAEREVETGNKERAVRRREVQALADSNQSCMDKLQRQATQHQAETSKLQDALSEAQHLQ
jgi:hypothetical protein